MYSVAVQIRPYQPRGKASHLISGLTLSLADSLCPHAFPASSEEILQMDVVTADI